jgi:hypothetical protein
LAATGTFSPPPEGNPRLQTLDIAGWPGNKGSNKGIRVGSHRKRVLNMYPAKINGKLLIDAGLFLHLKYIEAFVLFEVAPETL